MGWEVRFGSGFGILIAMGAVLELPAGLDGPATALSPADEDGVRGEDIGGIWGVD